MGTKVKELNNIKDGDRNSCVLCSPKKDRIRMDQLWSWSLAHPGESPFKEGYYA